MRTAAHHDPLVCALPHASAILITALRDDHPWAMPALTVSLTCGSGGEGDGRGWEEKGRARHRMVAEEGADGQRDWTRHARYHRLDWQRAGQRPPTADFSSSSTCGPGAARTRPPVKDNHNIGTADAGQALGKLLAAFRHFALHHQIIAINVDGARATLHA
eukprot:scaffold11744_cov117-Isochrysis_galbana.AAC.2